MSNIVYIDFNVSRFCIVRSERSHEPVTTDNRNYIYARFTFTSEWNGLTKTAVFSRGDESLNVEIHNNECQIPNELLTSPGNITVSVFGGDRRTVSTATIQVVQSGFKDGLPPLPPTPPAMYVQTPDSTVPYIGYDGEFWFEAEGERKRIAGGGGEIGYNGWSPILSVITDVERRVLRVNDWTGGSGTKPQTGQYIGATGLVNVISQAIDIRGQQGLTGQAGSDGNPAIGIHVGNEAVTIACNTNRTVTVDTIISIPFWGLIGGERADATAVINNLPSGVTITQNTPSTTAVGGTVILTIAEGSALGGTTQNYDNISLIGKFTVNSKAFYKHINISKAVAGKDGATGAQGIPGKDATINDKNVLEIVDGENTTVVIEGKTLKINATASGGIPDAPIDNNQYARRNAEWSKVDPARQFNWRGEFVLGNTYNINDIVQHDGADWIATIDGIVLPPPSMGWDLFIDRGQPGLSAYELAVEQGFVGTLDEWLESLIGPQGDQGPMGPRGEPGAGRIEDVLLGGASVVSDNIANLPAYPTSLPANGGNAATLAGYTPATLPLTGVLSAEVSSRITIARGPRDFRIPVSKWISSTTYPKYPYTATTDSNYVSISSLVRADFDVSSFILAQDAGVSGAGTTGNGTITFYSETIPTGDLTGSYTVNNPPL